MADDRRLVISSEPHLAPEEISRRTFSTVFRGFDPVEVRTYLSRVADELALMRERYKHLEQQLLQAESKVEHTELDEDALTSALGEESARVLKTAKQAAADIKTKAEENVERLLRQAHAEAERIRHESEGVLAQRTKEASEIAESIRQAASDDAASVRARAASEAEAMVDAARERSREMLDEAKALRSKILSDVTRRRNAARVQVAQLRAGRDRLLDAYRVVRETLDQVTKELERADDEARASAETAGRRVAEEVEAIADELDVDLDAGDELEVPIVASPAIELEPVVDEPAPVAFVPDEPAPVVSSPKPPAEATAIAAELDEVAAAAEVAVVQPTKPQPAPELVQALAAGELTVLEPEAPIEAVRVLPPDEAGALESEPTVEKPVVVEAEPTAPATNGSHPDAPAETSEPSDPDADSVRRRDEETAPLEAQLARKLKRALQDEQNDVLDRLRVHRGKLDEVLATADEQASRYRRVARPVLDQAARAGAGFVGQTRKPRVSFDEQAGELASAIAGPLRTRLEAAFEQATRDGDDEGAVIERIGAAYREWKMQRIERLAGDHVAAAFTRGTYAAAADDTKLRWIVSDLDGPCPDCDDNALAGPTTKGETYPTGQLHPPAHGGCRCLLLPVEA